MLVNRETKRNGEMEKGKLHPQYLQICATQCVHLTAVIASTSTLDSFVSSSKFSQVRLYIAVYVLFYCYDSWKAERFSLRAASNTVYLANFSLWFMLLLIHMYKVATYITSYIISGKTPPPPPPNFDNFIVFVIPDKRQPPQF